MTILKKCIRTSELTKSGVYGYTIKEEVVADRKMEHVNIDPNTAYFMFYDIDEQGNERNQSYRVFLGKRVSYDELSLDYNANKGKYESKLEEEEIKSTLITLYLNKLDSACKMPNGAYLPMESGDVTLSELRDKILADMKPSNRPFDYYEIMDSINQISSGNNSAVERLRRYINLVGFTTNELGIKIGNDEQPKDDLQTLIANNQRLLQIIRTLLPKEYKNFTEETEQPKTLN